MKCEFYLITTKHMTQEQTVEFVPLLNHEDYEILNVYQYTIRRADDHHEVKEYEQTDGYIFIKLDGKPYKKHRLIAQQFIPNPNNLPQVDHINRDRADNHLINLRWVSCSINSQNKSSFNGRTNEYVDDIPDESIVVNDYGKHEFENYYYYNDVFYFYNGVQYRKLHMTELKNGSKVVWTIDTNGRKVRIFYAKFKKIFNLI